MRVTERPPRGRARSERSARRRLDRRERSTCRTRRRKSGRGFGQRPWSHRPHHCGETRTLVMPAEVLDQARWRRRGRTSLRPIQLSRIARDALYGLRPQGDPSPGSRRLTTVTDLRSDGEIGSRRGSCRRDRARAGFRNRGRPRESVPSGVDASALRRSLPLRCNRLRSAASLSSGGPAARQRPAERDLVGVLEVAADREARSRGASPMTRSRSRSAR